MKKLTIPAILLFWVLILVVGVLVMNRPHDPPPPPPPPPTPANVEVEQGPDGNLVRIVTQAGDTVVFQGARVDYAGPVEGTSYHLVAESHEDGDLYTTVVDEASGRQVVMVGEPRLFNSGRWLASADANGVIGYSWVDLVELTDGGPERILHLDAYRLGLRAEEVRWSKTAAFTVDVAQRYAGWCDAEEDPALAVTRNEDGSWDVWLDEARTVALVDSLTMRVEGEEPDTVEGRFLGFIPDTPLGDRVPVFDRAWTQISDGELEAESSRLVLALESGLLETGGWPVFDAEDTRFFTTALPCGTRSRTPASTHHPLSIFEERDGAWTSVGSFPPQEMGWTATARNWSGEDRLEISGWVEGALIRRPEGDWVPEHTGAFQQDLPPMGSVPPGILEAVDELAVGFPGSEPAAVLPAEGAPDGPYRYLGFSLELRSHLVRAGTGDTGRFLLVSQATGEIWSVPGVPILTESGERFAAMTARGYGSYELSIFDWSPEEGPVERWSGTVENVEDARWRSERYFSLGSGDAVQLNRHTDGEERWSRGVG